MKLLILNGPNMNMLGRREPEIYGTRSLDEIIERTAAHAASLGFETEHMQSNHEGVLIDRIQEAGGIYDAILINPGALTHYSYALRDAIACCPIPVGEVHMSNILAREPFRATDVIEDVCAFRIMGMGENSYTTAVSMLADILKSE